MHILYLAGAEKVPGNNGGSVHVWEVSRELKKLGYEVTILTHRYQGEEKHQVTEGIRIMRYNLKFKNIVIPLVNIVKLFFIIKKFKVNLIIERYKALGGAGAILSYFFKVPLIFEVNGPQSEEAIFRHNIKNNLLKFLIKGWSILQFKMATKIISPLSTVVPVFALNKTTIVTWGANTDILSKSLIKSDRTKKIKKQYNLQDNIKVVFLGTFQPWHGVRELIEIAARVISKNNKIIFLLIGDGKLKPWVEEEIKAQNLIKNVLLLGEQKYEDIPYFLSLCDIGIAPFQAKYYPPLLRYGFFWSPLKIFEYMASGLAVITSDYDPLREIVVDNKAGFVVDSDCIEDFSQKILQLAETPALITKLGINASDSVRRYYSWKMHVSQLNNVIGNIMVKGN